MEKVCIFIDGSNFYHGLRHNLGRTAINFHYLGQKLCDRRKLVRTYYYNAPLDREDNEEAYKAQQRFFDSLRSTPYIEIKLGRMVQRNGFKIEKGVDVFLAVDMLRFAYTDVYDTAVLVSGDGDFVSVVNAVKDLGKHVENVQFQSGWSAHLSECCDLSTVLDEEYLEGCFMEYR
ncbi:uncharacterized LabA/DUF88 family protein [Methanofollis sp. W23]|uniref:LabA-like NYN domain-containing protein n=1 Tax=Methanofollis sp. W23 TaxID=2817849 RepID=UPI001AE27EF4|nr:NYN domain-containing protein [Methanofollis sp. W23]MBP2146279.1 uncharacterized LabA/DUF88 family protein [Methanofollis sp. W23]